MEDYAEKRNLGIVLAARMSMWALYKVMSIAEMGEAGV